MKISSSHAITPVASIVEITDKTHPAVPVPLKDSSIDESQNTENIHETWFFQAEMPLDTQTLLALQDVNQRLLSQIGQNYYSNLSK